MIYLSYVCSKPGSPNQGLSCTARMSNGQNPSRLRVAPLFLTSHIAFITKEYEDAAVPDVGAPMPWFSLSPKIFLNPRTEGEGRRGTVAHNEG